MWAGFFLTADRQGSVQLCSQGYIILFRTDSFHLIICQSLNNPQTYMLGAPSPAWHYSGDGNKRWSLERGIRWLEAWLGSCTMKVNLVSSHLLLPALFLVSTPAFTMWASLFHLDALPQNSIETAEQPTEAWNLWNYDSTKGKKILPHKVFSSCTSSLTNNIPSVQHGTDSVTHWRPDAVGQRLWPSLSQSSESQSW